MIPFGLVPSRRLGRSLGINNTPPKHCTYSCTYCLVGWTTDMVTERRHFYPPEVILAGMVDFARSFKGTLVTDTLFVEGVNDGNKHVRQLAGFLGRLRPSKAYLSIPARPPAEEGVRAPSEETINRAFQIIRRSVPHVEYLTGYDGTTFTFTGYVEQDLLRIAAVHPLREEAAGALLTRDHAGRKCVDELVQNQKLAEVTYAGRTYYTRKWSDQ